MMATGFLILSMISAVIFGLSLAFLPDREIDRSAALFVAALSGTAFVGFLLAALVTFIVSMVF